MSPTAQVGVACPGCGRKITLASHELSILIECAGCATRFVPSQLGQADAPQAPAPAKPSRNGSVSPSEDLEEAGDDNAPRKKSGSGAAMALLVGGGVGLLLIVVVLMRLVVLLDGNSTAVHNAVAKPNAVLDVDKAAQEKAEAESKKLNQAPPATQVTDVPTAQATDVPTASSDPKVVEAKRQVAEIEKLLDAQRAIAARSPAGPEEQKLRDLEARFAKAQREYGRAYADAADARDRRLKETEIERNRRDAEAKARAEAEKAVKDAAAHPNPATLAKFDEVYDDAPYSAVEKIMGCPGQHTSHRSAPTKFTPVVGPPPPDTVDNWDTYIWKNQDGSSMQVNFYNDCVHAKSQVGLR
jgi:hypothetical protein